MNQKTKEILEKQLQLLSYASEHSIPISDLADVTDVMVRVAEMLEHHDTKERLSPMDQIRRVFYVEEGK